MNKSLVLKNKFYLFFSFIFSFFLFLYLIYFVINGQRGIVNYFKLKNSNNYHINELEILNQDNALLLNKIERLQTNSIDLDYLEEKLRKNTGLAENNEITVIFD